MWSIGMEHEFGTCLHGSETGSAFGTIKASTMPASSSFPSFTISTICFKLVQILYISRAICNAADIAKVFFMLPRKIIQMDHYAFICPRERNSIFVSKSIKRTALVKKRNLQLRNQQSGIRKSQWLWKWKDTRWRAIGF